MWLIKVQKNNFKPILVRIPILIQTSAKSQVRSAATDCICTVHVVRSLNLLTPTHAHILLKNHLKNSYMFQSTTIFRELQYPR